ncbi:putative CCR4-NOT transcription complex subunit 1 [Monocercomonoides exilis]|uniref:putative CCR4-NOT transcription complex subunit 1 n=1 Tax=Monocercomonoides exilis TaxID=2049356 RepID=UPI00355A1890|nr:putative CCR4-NOT transcription complex subunit 1 [Monocercomonoides exilis]|eukprot:MONOS_2291.1-p1 / transcript=MONOS_2291.1 / gene=MONOS_2291 / organism=Monocercomonoides_exilis_PA203 / gene_product=ccr4-not transcription complex / transcript_product=ccr4-not transcription complex / location=Mono_scaffold00046:115570-130710(+) / protein_length=4843 / sequence_SO=supercontig / SO=protein_coding / is_pseudo=false
MTNEENYIEEDLIAKGTTSVVYTIRNKKDGRIYVWKKSQLEAKRIVPRQFQLFQFLTQLMTKIHSPFIIRMHACFSSNSFFHIVLDYGGRRTLRDEIISRQNEKKPFSEQETWALLAQMIHAVADLHAAKLHHGAICPDSFFITDEGYLKMKTTNIKHNKEQNVPEKAGQSHYRLQEQPKPPNPSDIFALGVITHELLTLSLPSIVDDTKSVNEKKAQNAVPQPPKGVSSELWGLIWEMLKVQPNARPKSEFILKLPQIKNHLKELSIQFPSLGTFDMDTLTFAVQENQNLKEKEKESPKEKEMEKDKILRALAEKENEARLAELATPLPPEDTDDSASTIKSDILNRSMIDMYSDVQLVNLLNACVEVKTPQLLMTQKDAKPLKSESPTEKSIESLSSRTLNEPVISKLVNDMVTKFWAFANEKQRSGHIEELDGEILQKNLNRIAKLLMVKAAMDQLHAIVDRYAQLKSAEEEREKTEKDSKLGHEDDSRWKRRKKKKAGQSDTTSDTGTSPSASSHMMPQLETEPLPSPFIAFDWATVVCYDGPLNMADHRIFIEFLYDVYCVGSSVKLLLEKAIEAEREGMIANLMDGKPSKWSDGYNFDKAMSVLTLGNGLPPPPLFPLHRVFTASAKKVCEATAKQFQSLAIATASSSTVPSSSSSSSSSLQPQPLSSSTQPSTPSAPEHQPSLLWRNTKAQLDLIKGMISDTQAEKPFFNLRLFQLDRIIEETIRISNSNNANTDTSASSSSAAAAATLSSSTTPSDSASSASASASSTSATNSSSTSPTSTSSSSSSSTTSSPADTQNKIESKLNLDIERRKSAIKPARSQEQLAELTALVTEEVTFARVTPSSVPLCPIETLPLFASHSVPDTFALFISRYTIGQGLTKRMYNIFRCLDVLLTLILIANDDYQRQQQQAAQAPVQYRIFDAAKGTVTESSRFISDAILVGIFTISLMRADILVTLKSLTKDCLMSFLETGIESISYLFQSAAKNPKGSLIVPGQPLSPEIISERISVFDTLSTPISTFCMLRWINEDLLLLAVSEMITMVKLRYRHIPTPRNTRSDPRILTNEAALLLSLLCRKEQIFSRLMSPPIKFKKIPQQLAQTPQIWTQASIAAVLLSVSLADFEIDPRAAFHQAPSSNDSAPSSTLISTSSSSFLPGDAPIPLCDPPISAISWLRTTMLRDPEIFFFSSVQILTTLFVRTRRAVCFSRHYRRTSVQVPGKTVQEKKDELDMPDEGSLSREDLELRVKPSDILSDAHHTPVPPVFFSDELVPECLISTLVTCEVKDDTVEHVPVVSSHALGLLLRFLNANTAFCSQGPLNTLRESRKILIAISKLAVSPAVDELTFIMIDDLHKQQDSKVIKKLNEWKTIPAVLSTLRIPDDRIRATCLCGRSFERTVLNYVITYLIDIYKDFIVKGTSANKPIAVAIGTMIAKHIIEPPEANEVLQLTSKALQTKIQSSQFTMAVHLVQQLLTNLSDYPDFFRSLLSNQNILQFNKSFVSQLEYRLKSLQPKTGEAENKQDISSDHAHSSTEVKQNSQGAEGTITTAQPSSSQPQAQGAINVLNGASNAGAVPNGNGNQNITAAGDGSAARGTPPQMVKSSSSLAPAARVATAANVGGPTAAAVTPGGQLIGASGTNLAPLDVGLLNRGIAIHANTPTHFGHSISGLPPPATIKDQRIIATTVAQPLPAHTISHPYPAPSPHTIQSQAGPPVPSSSSEGNVSSHPQSAPPQQQPASTTQQQFTPFITPTQVFGPNHPPNTIFDSASKATGAQRENAPYPQHFNNNIPLPGMPMSNSQGPAAATPPQMPTQQLPGSSPTGFPQAAHTQPASALSVNSAPFTPHFNTPGSNGSTSANGAYQRDPFIPQGQGLPGAAGVAAGDSLREMGEVGMSPPPGPSYSPKSFIPLAQRVQNSENSKRSFADALRKSQFTVTSNIELLLMSPEQRDVLIPIPPDNMQGQLMKIMNTVSRDNVTEKAQHLKKLCKEYSDFVAKFVVLVKATQFENQAKLYSDLVAETKDSQIRRKVEAELFSACSVLIRFDHSSSEKGYERNQLAALGSFLGYFVICNNRPIPSSQLDLKAALIYGHQTGRLHAIVPFVHNILIHCKESYVFRNPCQPWLFSIVELLRELYQLPIRKSIKYKIEAIEDGLGKLQLDSSYRRSTTWALDAAMEDEEGLDYHHDRLYSGSSEHKDKKEKESSKGKDSEKEKEKDEISGEDSAPLSPVEYPQGPFPLTTKKLDTLTKYPLLYNPNCEVEKKLKQSDDSDHPLPLNSTAATSESASASSSSSSSSSPSSEQAASAESDKAAETEGELLDSFAANTSPLFCDYSPPSEIIQAIKNKQVAFAPHLPEPVSHLIQLELDSLKSPVRTAVPPSEAFSPAELMIPAEHLPSSVSSVMEGSLLPPALAKLVFSTSAITTPTASDILKEAEVLQAQLAKRENERDIERKKILAAEKAKLEKAANLREKKKTELKRFASLHPYHVFELLCEGYPYDAVLPSILEEVAKECDGDSFVPISTLARMGSSSSTPEPISESSSRSSSDLCVGFDRDSLLCGNHRPIPPQLLRLRRRPDVRFLKATHFVSIFTEDAEEEFPDRALPPLMHPQSPFMLFLFTQVVEVMRNIPIDLFKYICQKAIPSTIIGVMYMILSEHSSYTGTEKISVTRSQTSSDNATEINASSTENERPEPVNEAEKAESDSASSSSSAVDNRSKETKLNESTTQLTISTEAYAICQDVCLGQTLLFAKEYFIQHGVQKLIETLKLHIREDVRDHEDVEHDMIEIASFAINAVCDDYIYLTADMVWKQAMAFLNFVLGEHFSVRKDAIRYLTEMAKKYNCEDVLTHAFADPLRFHPEKMIMLPPELNHTMNSSNLVRSLSTINSIIPENAIKVNSHYIINTLKGNESNKKVVITPLSSMMDQRQLLASREGRNIDLSILSSNLLRVFASAIYRDSHNMLPATEQYKWEEYQQSLTTVRISLPAPKLDLFSGKKGTDSQSPLTYFHGNCYTNPFTVLELRRHLENVRNITAERFRKRLIEFHTRLNMILQNVYKIAQLSVDLDLIAKEQELVPPNYPSLEDVAKNVRQMLQTNMQRALDSPCQFRFLKCYFDKAKNEQIKIHLEAHKLQRIKTLSTDMRIFIVFLTQTWALEYNNCLRRAVELTYQQMVQIQRQQQVNVGDIGTRQPVANFMAQSLLTAVNGIVTAVRDRFLFSAVHRLTRDLCNGPPASVRVFYAPPIFSFHRQLVERQHFTWKDVIEQYSSLREKNEFTPKIYNSCIPACVNFSDGAYPLSAFPTFNSRKLDHDLFFTQLGHQLQKAGDRSLKHPMQDLSQMRIKSIYEKLNIKLDWESEDDLWMENDEKEANCRNQRLPDSPVFAASAFYRNLEDEIKKLFKGCIEEDVSAQAVDSARSHLTFNLSSFIEEGTDTIKEEEFIVPPIIRNTRYALGYIHSPATEVFIVDPYFKNLNNEALKTDGRPVGVPMTEIPKLEDIVANCGNLALLLCTTLPQEEIFPKDADKAFRLLHVHAIEALSSFSPQIVHTAIRETLLYQIASSASSSPEMAPYLRFGSAALLPYDVFNLPIEHQLTKSEMAFHSFYDEKVPSDKMPHLIRNIDHTNATTIITEARIDSLISSLYMLLEKGLLDAPPVLNLFTSILASMWKTTFYLYPLFPEKKKNDKKKGLNREMETYHLDEHSKDLLLDQTLVENTVVGAIPHLMMLIRQSFEDASPLPSQRKLSPAERPFPCDIDIPKEKKQAPVVLMTLVPSLVLYFHASLKLMKFLNELSYYSFLVTKKRYSRKVEEKARNSWTNDFDRRESMSYFTQSDRFQRDLTSNFASDLWSYRDKENDFLQVAPHPLLIYAVPLIQLIIKIVHDWIKISSSITCFSQLTVASGPLNDLTTITDFLQAKNVGLENVHVQHELFCDLLKSRQTNPSSPTYPHDSDERSPAVRLSIAWKQIDLVLIELPKIIDTSLAILAGRVEDAVSLIQRNLPLSLSNAADTKIGEAKSGAVSSSSNEIIHGSNINESSTKGTEEENLDDPSSSTQSSESIQKLPSTNFDANLKSFFVGLSDQLCVVDPKTKAISLLGALPNMEERKRKVELEPVIFHKVITQDNIATFVKEAYSNWIRTTPTCTERNKLIQTTQIFVNWADEHLLLVDYRNLRHLASLLLDKASDLRADVAEEKINPEKAQNSQTKEILSERLVFFFQMIIQRQPHTEVALSRRIKAIFREVMAAVEGLSFRMKEQGKLRDVNGYIFTTQLSVDPKLKPAPNNSPALDELYSEPTFAYHLVCSQFHDLAFPIVDSFFSSLPNPVKDFTEMDAARVVGQTPLFISTINMNFLEKKDKLNELELKLKKQREAELIEQSSIFVFCDVLWQMDDKEMFTFASEYLVLLRQPYMMNRMASNRYAYTGGDNVSQAPVYLFLENDLWSRYAHILAKGFHALAASPPKQIQEKILASASLLIDDLCKAFPDFVATSIPYFVDSIPHSLTDILNKITSTVLVSQRIPSHFPNPTLPLKSWSVLQTPELSIQNVPRVNYRLITKHYLEDVDAYVSEYLAPNVDERTKIRDRLGMIQKLLNYTVDTKSSTLIPPTQSADETLPRASFLEKLTKEDSNLMEDLYQMLTITSGIPFPYYLCDEFALNNVARYILCYVLDRSVIHPGVTPLANRLFPSNCFGKENVVISPFAISGYSIFFALCKSLPEPLMMILIESISFSLTCPSPTTALAAHSLFFIAMNGDVTALTTRLSESPSESKPSLFTPADLKSLVLPSPPTHSQSNDFCNSLPIIQWTILKVLINRFKTPNSPPWGVSAALLELLNETSFYQGPLFDEIRKQADKTKTE